MITQSTNQYCHCFKMLALSLKINSEKKWCEKKKKNTTKSHA